MSPAGNSPQLVEVQQPQAVVEVEQQQQQPVAVVPKSQSALSPMHSERVAEQMVVVAPNQMVVVAPKLSAARSLKRVAEQRVAFANPDGYVHPKDRSATVIVRRDMLGSAAVVARTPLGTASIVGFHDDATATTLDRVFAEL